MKIVIAPDSFKESLTASEACEAIARGVRSVLPDADLDLVPMADGGEGTVAALVAATDGQLVMTPVTGPLGESVEAVWGLLGSAGDGAAVIDMSAASGLMLVAPERRNPLRTTTFGTGELIRAVLDRGVRRIIMGIGGSATNDGGAGAAQAVDVLFRDDGGQLLGNGLAGGDLDKIKSIDLSHRDTRLTDCDITVACDVNNPLCGPSGASAIYGPQKGATPEMVTTLDRNLAHLASLIERDLGRRIADVAGSGAAGGLGAGMLAFFDADLRGGVEMVMNAVGLQQRIQGADLLITGEGRLDAQSMMGKLIAGVGGVGRQAGVPVIALVGSTGDGADETLGVLDAYYAIADGSTPVSEAMAQAATLLERRAAEIMRDRS